jgi:hypothetical protein
MKRVSEYETTDAQRFTDRKAAEDHQFNIDLGAAARALAAQPEAGDAQVGAALRLGFDIRRARTDRTAEAAS